MTCYSIEPKVGYLKKCVLLFFAKNMGKNVGKNVSKNVSSKHSPGMLAARQKPPDQTKQSVTDALKTASKRAIQSIAEVTGDSIGNRTPNKVTKNSPQSNARIYIYIYIYI